MTDQITILSQTPGSLHIQLKNPAALDTSLFSRMEKDSHSLSSMVTDENKGVIMYSTRNLIRLSDFLSHYTFKNKEAYRFLIFILEKAIAVNRSKPVLLDPDCIYVSPYGDEVYFAVVPLYLEYWMFQKEESLLCLEKICDLLQSPQAYEIPGFIQAFKKSSQFSLPNLLCALKDLEQQYTPRRYFWQPKKPAGPFRTKEPVAAGSLGPVSNEPDRLSFAQTANQEKESSPVLNLAGSMETQVLWQQPQQARAAWLEIEKEQYDLPFETMSIGRSATNDIRLAFEDVSASHAKITCSQGRYYLQDLKSTNGTFLNEKQVIRKMRLKEGMVIRFGKTEALFHE